MAPDDPQRSTSSAPRVVCVGHTVWDQVWMVDALPAGGGKSRADDFRGLGGGMAATAAVTVARLGGRASFWGRAGDDPAGHAMRAELATWGVDVQQLRLVPGGRSSVSGILVDREGERRIVNFRGADLPDDPGGLPLDELPRVGAVLVDPRWPAGARAALRAAREAGVPTVLDGDVADSEIFDRLLPWVDCAIFSEPGLAGYARGAADVSSRLLHALRAGCRLAAVTQGDRGVSWTDGGPLQHQPAFRVPVADTTGAGDVFHGAFAWALAAGRAVPQAMRLAAATAALKCRRPGGRAGIPDLATVLAMLNTATGDTA